MPRAYLVLIRRQMQLSPELTRNVNAGSGGNDGGSGSGGGGGGKQHTRRRTQRRVTHNEKRYHSVIHPRFITCYNYRRKLFVVSQSSQVFFPKQPMSLPRRCNSGMNRLDPVSRDARRFEEEHQEEERSERYKHVESVNESGRVSAGVTYLSESWDQTRHKRSPLIGRPISEQSTPNKTGDTTLPGITAHLPHVGDGQSKDARGVSPATRAMRRGNRRLTRNESRYHSAIPKVDIYLTVIIDFSIYRPGEEEEKWWRRRARDLFLAAPLLRIGKVWKADALFRVDCQNSLCASPSLRSRDEVRQEAVQQALAQAMQNRHKPSMPMPSKRTSVMARSPDRDQHDSAAVEESIVIAPRITDHGSAV
ncbi:hypothetical protein GEV33_005530 [Tenebrio molitor]|uniref:Uncharacterized protein n=1 Tax=Tenebrio molitor TaxID=7067 RepID=A0A8J6HLG4_TENMO|nr:hypothetical protein GEV33_005530 [Tenebrio molitor]